MNTPELAATTQQLTSITRVAVGENETIGTVVPGMLVVASTPNRVVVAEMACGRLVKEPLQPAQITVGSGVVIDRLAPSEVGAQLVIKARLVNCERKPHGPRRAIEDRARTSPRSSTRAPRCRSKRS
jgi:predicted thioesterase